MDEEKNYYRMEPSELAEELAKELSFMVPKPWDTDLDLMLDLIHERGLYVQIAIGRKVSVSISHDCNWMPPTEISPYGKYVQKKDITRALLMEFLKWKNYVLPKIETGDE